VEWQSLRKQTDPQSLLASILSVLAMTYSDTGKRDTLYFRLISGSEESPGSWGHEYVRHLAAELGEEYNSRFSEVEDEPASAPNEKKESNGVNGDVHMAVDGEATTGTQKAEKREYQLPDLRKLSMELVEFFLKHNAEADAVDLLLELEDIKSIVDKVDDKTWPRVCQYMVG
jgi:26S proteasome regulatory subunit N1